MTPEDLQKTSQYLAKRYPDDYDEVHQTAYIAGLEAIEEGRTNVYSYMLQATLDYIAFKESPVEIPKSGPNRVALAKVRRGETPETPSERRIASVVGTREEVLPITITTTDTPESLLVERETLETLEGFLQYDNLYLTPQQRDALGVRFFKTLSSKEFMEKYGVGRDSIRWHSERALDKIRKVLG